MREQAAQKKAEAHERHIKRITHPANEKLISDRNPLPERCRGRCHFEDLEFACGFGTALHCTYCGWPDGGHYSKEQTDKWRTSAGLV